MAIDVLDKNQPYPVQLTIFFFDRINPSMKYQYSIQWNHRPTASLMNLIMIQN